MLKGTFIGFQIKKGSFVAEGGEVIDYNNRLIRIITAEHETPDNVGFIMVESKMKRDVLAQSLGCAATDEAVDSTLRSLVLKDIGYVLTPVNGKFEIGGIFPDNKK